MTMTLTTLTLTGMTDDDDADANDCAPGLSPREPKMATDAGALRPLELLTADEKPALTRRARAIYDNCTDNALRKRNDTRPANATAQQNPYFPPQPTHSEPPGPARIRPGPIAQKRKAPT